MSRTGGLRIVDCGLWVVVVFPLVGLAMTGCERTPFDQWLGKKQAAAQPASAPPAPTVKVTDPGVLAVVNDAPITKELFQRRIDALPEDHPDGFMTMFGSARVIHRKPRTAEERRILLEELMKEELAVQDAIALGLERDPAVKRQLEELKRQILLQELVQRDTTQVTVTDQEVQDFYNRFQAGYKEPERIHVRQIVTQTLQQAEAVRATAIGGADFTQLARDHSVGAGKDQGGDVGWYLREFDRQLLVTLTGKNPTDHTFFPQLEPVAFALEIGQISQPVKGPDGYYLVKLEERVAATQKPVSEVWDQIREGLLIQKRQQSVQDHLDRLWKNAKVKDINDQRLEQ